MRPLPAPEIPHKVLRPYQDLICSRLLELLVEREQDIVVGMPPGSGKTSTLQYLMASHMATEKQFTVFLVVVPSVALVNQWGAETKDNLETPGWVKPVFKVPNGLMALFDAQPEPNLANPHFWTSKNPAIYVTTRQALISKRVKATLAKLPKDACKRVLVISDEGHHHVEEKEGKKGTSCGNTTKRIRDLGGTEIRLSGTPWHADVSMKNEGTKTISLPAGRYAREVDLVTGLPFAPRKWRPIRSFFHVKVDSLAQISQGGASSKTEKSANFAAIMPAYIKEMVRQWVADKCPKTIFKVPREFWGEPLQEALEESIEAAKKLRHKPRILNMVGDQISEHAGSLLAFEAKGTTTFKESQVDAILACSRADEGLDWRMCSHVYCARIPSSPRLLLQLWFRAGRGKHEIVGYPEQWKDEQVIRFFLPIDISQSIKDEMWKEHRDMALMLACYLEDADTADKWVNDPPSFTKFGKMKPGSKKYEETKKAAVQELKELGELGDDFDLAKAKSEVYKKMIVSPGGEINFGQTRKTIAGDRKLSEPQRTLQLQALDDILKIQHKKARAAFRRKRGGGIVRADKRAEWDSIACQFDHIMLKTPSKLLEIVAEFAASSTEEIEQSYRDQGDFPWSVEIIRAEAEKYKGIYGVWPNAASKDCPGFGGRRWSAADVWLTTQGTTLSRFLRRDFRWSEETIQKAIAEYQLRYGERPYKTSGAIDGLPGRCWRQIDKFLEKQGSSLAKRFADGFVWSEELILKEATTFRKQHDRWPSNEAGVHPGFQGRTWAAAGSWLSGQKGTSLSILLKGPLIWDQDLILREAHKFRDETGTWPTTKSGTWPGFEGKHWGAAQAWLYNRGSSLHKLLTKGFIWSEELILKEATAFKEQHGHWPSANTGNHPGFQGRTWASASSWMRKQGNSLSILLKGPLIWDRDLILREARKFREENGTWPTNRSGPWPGFEGKHWNSAESWLYNRGSSLHKLLELK